MHFTRHLKVHNFFAARVFAFSLFSCNFDDQFSQNFYRFVFWCIHWDTQSEWLVKWLLSISLFATVYIGLLTLPDLSHAPSWPFHQFQLGEDNMNIVKSASMQQGNILRHLQRQRTGVRFPPDDPCVNRTQELTDSCAYTHRCMGQTK